MRTLVIDSATEACSVALFDDATMVAGEYRLLGRGHAEQLVPMISRLPENGRAQRVAVALGPGSFTGVRVGLAAARALGFAWQAEVIGYPTLALVAAMTRAKEGGLPLAVAMTGGHGEWFVQGFDAQGAADRPLASLSPQAAAAETTELLIAGSQAEALIAARGNGHAVPMLPDARSFGELPRSSLMSDISPLYGRAPDARLPGAIT